MYRECEVCCRKYNLGISGNTLEGVHADYSLCNYCSDIFDEEKYRKENGIDESGWKNPDCN
jgi:hypothetical protein